MKTASLTEVKNDLSRFVEQVRKGERVRILVRGVPAADLVPAGSDEAEDGWLAGEIEELERHGIIVRGSGGFPAELGRPGPRVKRGSAVRLLLDERRR